MNKYDNQEFKNEDDILFPKKRYKKKEDLVKLPFKKRAKSIF
jgi:hypothetical protein